MVFVAVGAAGVAGWGSELSDLQCWAKPSSPVGSSCLGCVWHPMAGVEFWVGL